MSHNSLVLASTSPRRISLLKQLNISYQLVDPGDAENSVSMEPLVHVREHAKSKAETVAVKFPDKIVIAADTIVVLDDRILEKPKNIEEAKSMLRSLGGKTHMVISAIALIGKNRKVEDVRTEETRVTLKELDDGEIEVYVSIGESMDKAGAYAAQGIGAIIITRVEGCFYNVIGLPISLLYDMLKDAGIDILTDRR